MPEPTRRSKLDRSAPTRLILDDVEAEALQAFAEALGVAAVRPSDDFVAAGGTPETADLAAKRLARSFRVPLDRNDLLAVRTPERAARLVRRRSSNLRRQIVSVRRGESADRSLFLVLPESSDIRLARQLAQRATTFGINAVMPLEIDPEDPPETMTAFAAEYARLIRRVRPAGPYCVAGFCAAGVVALEAARHLRAQGLQVPFVCLIATPHPATAPPPDRASLRRILGVQDEVLRRCPELGWELEAVEAALAAFPSPSVVVRLEDALRRHAEPLLGLTPDAASRPLLSAEERETIARRLLSWATLMLLWVRHRPEPYDGDVTLLEEATMPDATRRENRSLWRRTITGELRTATVDVSGPGAHHRLMADRQVSDVVDSAFTRAA